MQLYDKLLKRLNNFSAIQEVFSSAEDRALEEYPVEIGACSKALDNAEEEGLKAVIKYIKTGRRK